jgi:hypothetical protein
MKKILLMSAVLPIFLAHLDLSWVAQAQDAPIQLESEGNGLPVSEVVLFSSGVGFFHRDGTVNGQSQVDLKFKTEDINDLLKSMVVQDHTGGRIRTVTYDSRDPLAKTLKSFAIDLTENPSLGQLLNQVRGERVEIQWPTQVTGIILGLERKTEVTKEGKEIRHEYLNLLTDEGFQSIPLAQASRIKLLNERLNQELIQALQVLATSKDTQRKTVSILFDGDGERSVSVAYITQTPVWKTSYRLVLGEDRPYLQGWAIVENTSDDDWNDVRLSLVSGRPISFTMDLYQPLYTTRPEVVPELYASLRPQVYEDSMEARESYQFKQGESQVQEGPRQRLAFGGIGGGAMQPQAASRYGMPAPSSPARDSFAARAEMDLSQGVSPDAQGMQAGELFQYVVQSAVSLARQKSAMIPILSQNIEGEKISIYNQQVQPKHPLNGFRLTNSTPLHLMQGPITVFEEGIYAGDARIDDIAPGQDRLLSYALDLRTEVEPKAGPRETDLMSVSLKRGTLIARRTASQEMNYLVRNRDDKKKNLLIEHPFSTEWELVQPEAAAERTRQVYRFPMVLEENGSAQLQVREERQLSEEIRIASVGPDMIAFYLRSRKISPEVRDALENVVELRNRVSELSGERMRRETRIREITEEQNRIRENMARLSANSELYIRYVRTLDRQESELENLRQEMQTIRERERERQRELEEYLLGLDLD